MGMNSRPTSSTTAASIGRLPTARRTSLVSNGSLTRTARACAIACPNAVSAADRAACEISPSVRAPKPISAASCSNALARCVRTTLATLTGQIVMKIAEITIVPNRMPTVRSLGDRRAVALQHNKIEGEPDLPAGIGDALAAVAGPRRQQGHSCQQQEQVAEVGHQRHQ